MRRVRVLVVDDAVAVRRLLARMLESNPAVEVAGTAANGRIALTKLPQLNPDVVVLDVEMPELDGLKTLERIREIHPRLPVIMFSSHTERGAAATIDALSRGATDYVTKPSSLRDDASLEKIQESLIQKVLAVAGSKIGMALPGEVARPKTSRRQPREAVSRPHPPAKVVAIGASTGGPNVLASIVTGFPEDFPAPVLIVQHMPPLFTHLLAQRLDSQALIQVKEAVSGAELKPGQVWIAPGDRHMTVQLVDNVVTVQTNQDSPENSCRPSVDVLFRSVASVYGDRSLACVLTGMGRDGLRGAEMIHESGGQILVQDESSSIVWGMPGFVANAGLAERALPADEFGAEILRRVRGNGVKNYSRPVAAGRRL
jgi:two-component system chemotaxis response regulator CheB